MMKFDRVSDLKGFITFVVLSAPDKFPKIGGFTGDAEADLAFAFNNLRAGVERFKGKLPEEKRLAIDGALESAHQAYLGGEKIRGAHLLQDIQDLWFPKRFDDFKSRKCDVQ